MSTPPPNTPPPSSAPVPPPHPTGPVPPIDANPPSSISPKTKPNPKPIPNSFSVLEHTGIPRSVLTWKPKLPSRNWSIFLTIVGSITYLYYDDRRQCKKIKREYIEKVKWMADEPLSGSLDVPRKVRVYGGRWPEDDDEDRALRYFRKYVKPYLVAAAIDYEQIPAPLYGSITRQVQAKILKQRRQSLNLEPTPYLNLPGALDPSIIAQRELEGGTILIGRHSLKEYMEGLKRGWSRGVHPWRWEDEVEEALKGDGVFEEKVQEIVPDLGETVGVSTDRKPSTLPTGLSFLSRPSPPLLNPNFPSVSPDTPPQIPEHFHIPPSPLPPQPPMVMVPFVNHLGFKQFPLVIWDFFNERRRVLSGAQAAMKLINGETRDFVGPSGLSTEDHESPTFQASYDPSASSSSSSSISGPNSELDIAFDQKAESYYLKSFKELPNRFEKARGEYYTSLKDRLLSARSFESGERAMTPEEEKSTKPPVTEDDLREERKKKELRWRGMEEGYEIVRPETEVTWDEKWRGWLKVFDGDGEVHRKREEGEMTFT